MQVSSDDLASQLPLYLSDASKSELAQALKALPGIEGSRYYTTRVPDADPMQGDLWSGFVAFRHPDGARQEIAGLVLSNSCDLSSDNQRIVPKDLVFALVYPLGAFAASMQRSGINAATVESFVRDVRAQKISSLMYLPETPAGDPEIIADLSHLHSIPIGMFRANNPTRRRRLSNIGFYVFAFKLSIHFCRLHENVDRAA